MTCVIVGGDWDRC